LPERTIALIANGEPIKPESAHKILQDVEIIIAADGGALYCKKAGIHPHYIIGDLDSISDEVKQFFNNSEIIHLTDQYSTDMEKALKLASSLKPNRLKILSALGNRSDHANANLLFLREYNNEVPVEIYDNFGRLTILKPGKHILKLDVGVTVSFFSMGSIQNLFLKGFKYNLSNQNYESYFVGNSNVVVIEKCEVEFDSGSLFMYEVLDEFNLTDAISKTT